MYQYRSVCVTFFFELEANYQKSCGSLFFFFGSKRLLPKSPKNEVLVAAEPGKYLQNESQKAYVGQNWTKLLENSREDSLKSLLLCQKLTREYSYRYETLRAVSGREERVLVWVFS